jgi:hypothetical protein
MSETLEITKASTHTKAAQAWFESAEFVPLFDRLELPPLFTDYDKSQQLWVRETTGGRESMLDRRYFEQTSVLVDQMHYKESGLHHLGRHAIRRSLDIDNRLRQSILKSGTNGAFNVGVENEFFHFLAENGPAAVSYAIAMDIKRRTLEVAGWNDGLEIDIDSIVEAVEVKLQGSIPEFIWADFWENFSAQHVAIRALSVRGRVTFAREDQATDLTTYEDFSMKRRDRVIEPIEGNVMYIEVPFYSGEYGKNDYVPFHAKNAQFPKRGRTAISSGGRHPLHSMVHDSQSVEAYLQKREEGK